MRWPKRSSMARNVTSAGGLNQESDEIDSLLCPGMIFYTMKHRFARWVFFVAAAPVTLLLSGCSTVESRIADHPDIYHSLSARQQQLVANGQIAPGMPREAVYLAWGAPDQKVEGAMRRQMTETWIYVQYTTDYPDGYGYGYPYGYGRRGPGGGGRTVLVPRRRHAGRSFAVSLRRVE